MKKSVFIVFLAIFFVKSSIWAQKGNNVKLQHLDSFVKEFEEKKSVESARKVLEEVDFQYPLDSLSEMSSDKLSFLVYAKCADKLLALYQYATALQYEKECLNYAKKLPQDEDYLGEVYNSMGISYQSLGLYDRAIDSYKNCVDCSKRNGNFYNASADYNNITYLCIETNNLESARNYLSKSLEMLDTAKVVHGENLFMYYAGDIYFSASSLYSRMKQYDKALYYIEESYRIDSLANNEYMMHVCSFEKAKILKNMGQTDEATKIFEESYDYFSKKNVQRYVCLCLFYLEKYDEALAIARKNGNIDLKVQIIQELIFKETDISKMKQYAREYIQLKDSINSRANTLAMQGFNAEYDAQQREQTILQQKTTLEKQRIMWYWAWTIAALLVVVICISVRGWFRDNRNKKRISKALADLEVASAELEKTNSELDSTNKVKDKLIRVISHDLSGSTSNVNMLAHMVADKMKDELSMMLVSQSDNLKSFFDDLLIWVKMQRTGSMEIHMTNISLCQIADDVIKLIADTANGKELKLTHTIPQGTNIKADRSLIHCIIRNLVNNAVKFTPRGGTVTITFEQDTISVTDTGTGMSPDVVEKLLSGSQWVHTNGTEGEVGTGLGLSIVRDMVSMMNARLTIQSEVGKGSVFSVHLNS